MKPRAVVDTNSGNDSPVSTLALPAYPSISCSAPRWRITHSEVPGSAFSGTGLRHGRAVAAAGRGAAERAMPLQADTAPGHAGRGQAQERPTARLRVHLPKHPTYSP